ncbi:unnamed protein product [Sphagnum balticum]
MTRNRMESQQTLQLALNDVQAKLQNLQGVTEAKLDTMRGEVDKKLSETITKNFQSFDAVAKRLEELQLVTGQVVSLSQGVRDLSRILESPKLRGAMGEFQLGEMLRQVLPSDVYEEQFAIEGKLDAVIKLKEGFLCIDSKFPLNNARLLLETELDDAGIKSIRKLFSQDVKVMCDSIASKYIIAGKTLDFALMFIPAESVYYELLKDSELHQYCLKKHVIPVSPNSFYAYLQAIAVLLYWRISASRNPIPEEMSAGESIGRDLSRASSFDATGRYLPHPGWHEGWKYDTSWRPAWTIGVSFAPFVFMVDIPPGYWQCTAFERGNPKGFPIMVPSRLSPGRLRCALHLCRRT